MSERLLLLSVKRTVAVAAQPPWSTYLRGALAVLGVVVVLYGAADVITRVAHASLGRVSNTVAFGPAIEAVQPSAPVAYFVATTTPLMPTRLSIPAIGVDAQVELAGKKPDGSMEAPKTLYTVGWYSLGSEPGAPGNAVIAGHVNNALTKAGVFEHLSDLVLGNVIFVEDRNGKMQRYAVRDIEDYPSANAPLDAIFATTGPSQLVLITCAGDWDPKAHAYDHRLVIFAGLLAQ